MIQILAEEACKNSTNLITWPFVALCVGVAAFLALAVVGVSKYDRP